MSYAIVEIGGTQLRVEPGRFYEINHLDGNPDEAYTLDKVLLVHHDDEIIVGQPLVEGATVEGTILSHRRGRKVIVYKMKPKKKTRKKRGHRQELTRLMINSISMNGTVLAAEAVEDSQGNSANDTVLATESGEESQDMIEAETVETAAE